MTALRTVLIVVAGVSAGACAPSGTPPAHAPGPEAAGGETVQVGYGTQERDEVTGAISSVAAGEGWIAPGVSGRGCRREAWRSVQRCG